MKFFVYILRTSSNTLYIGQTNDLETRLEQHKNKKGAKYMKYFDSFELVYSEEVETRSKALIREAELKKLKKKKKEEMIKSFGR